MAASGMVSFGLDILPAEELIISQSGGQRPLVASIAS